MWTILQLDNHDKYDNTTRVSVLKLVTLWRAIKRDISKIMSMKSDQTERSHKIIINCKKRVLWRLEELINIRLSFGTNDKWEDILVQALQKIHMSKHWKNRGDYNLELQELIWSNRNDLSPCAITFLQTFMRVIARVPLWWVNTPFIP